MLDIFKLDMYRIHRAKMFYVCLITMSLVAGTMIILGIIPDFATVMGSDATDMTGSMMGIGMAFMIIGILFSLFICGEFTSGFAKNIFARHANPMHYIGGKLLSLTVTGTILILSFSLISMLLLAVSGSGVVLPGGVGGLITFLIGKIFACATFAAVTLLVCILTRKPAIGIIVGVVVSTGTIPMALNLAGKYLGLSWIPNILQYTVSGLANAISLVFNGPTFTAVIVGSLVWIAIFIGLGSRAVIKKDI